MTIDPFPTIFLNIQLFCDGRSLGDDHRRFRLFTLLANPASIFRIVTVKGGGVNEYGRTQKHFRLFGLGGDKTKVA